MKTYSDKISLIRNSRGVYCIDTVMGCPSGIESTPGGCYGDCYAARAAKRYGIDFSKAVLRGFTDSAHKETVLRQIGSAKMPFIRIGASGDPSENWEHTFKVLHELRHCNTEIVIITRHWNILTDAQLETLSGMNMCINTSVSALDEDTLRDKALSQFNRIKPHCKSVLRIVSCDFDIENETGRKLSAIQAQLFRNHPVIDTVFRPSKQNPLVTGGVVRVKNHFFNGRKQLASKFSLKTYMGKCDTCQEMCGVNLQSGINYQNRPGVVRQVEFDL